MALTDASEAKFASFSQESILLTVTSFVFDGCPLSSVGLVAAVVAAFVVASKGLSAEPNLVIANVNKIIRENVALNLNRFLILYI